MELWTPGELVSGDRPVYLRSADESALLTALSLSGSPCPRAILVRPNGEPALPLLQFMQNAQDRQTPVLINDRHAPAKAQTRRNQPEPTLEISRRKPSLDHLRGTRIESIEADFRPLVQAALDAVISLSTFSAAALIQAAAALVQAIEALESNAQMQRTTGAGRCNPLTAKLAHFLQNLGEQLILPMEQGILYVHNTNAIARRNWWNAQPVLLAACSNLQREIRSIGAPEHPPIVTKMESWLKALGVQSAKLALTIGGSHQVVFETASAWFVAGALRQIQCAHAGLGLLFLHRAVEWLFMAKAASENLIDFSRAGGEYWSRHLSPGERGGGFHVHLNILPIYVEFFGMFDLFKELNHWRNLLPYTHHMTVASDYQAYTLISKIIDGLPKFAGSVGWLNALTAFASLPPLELDDLIDPDGLLRSSLTII